MPPSHISRFHLSLLAGLLTILPVLFAERLPMVDLPQYAGQVAMLQALADGHWPYAEFFDINLLIPYWGAYGPLWMLSQFLPLALAAKLVVVAAICGLPLATAFLLRRFGGDPFWTWLVIPASFGFAFNWGFLNFLVAAPLGIVLLLCAESYANRPDWRGAVKLILLTHLLFFSHILVLFFFGAFSGLMVLFRARSFRGAMIGLGPLMSVGPIGLLWGLPSLGKAQVQWPVLWELGWHRLPDLPGLVLGLEDSFALFLICALIFLLPLAAGGRFSRSPERYLPFVACLAILFFAPNVLAGTFFTYHRFSLFLIPLYLFMIEPARVPATRARLADAAMVVLAAVWIAVICVRVDGYDQESHDFDVVLEKMAPEKRVLSLVFENGSVFSSAPVFVHYPVWYQAEKGGLVDFSFASFQGMPVQYKADRRPPVGPGFEWKPERFTWDLADGYDYIALRAPYHVTQSPMSLVNCRVTPVARSGIWWLYRVNPRSAAQAAPCGSAGPSM